MAILLLLVAGATSCGDKPEPALLNAGEISGRLTSVDSFKPTPIGPCDLESGSVLKGAQASNFRAWNRTVQGHHELVVVGRWRMSQKTAEARLRRLVRATVACDRSPKSKGYLVQGNDNGDPARPEWASGFDIFRYHGGQLLDVTRFYTWTGGYMVTAWGQSTDHERTYGDLRKIMNAQLRKVSSRDGR